MARLYLILRLADYRRVPPTDEALAQCDPFVLVSDSDVR